MRRPSSAPRAAVVVAVVMAVAACGGTDDRAADPPERIGEPPTTGPAPGGSGSAPTTTAARPPERVDLVEVAAVDAPTSMAFTSDGGRVFVTSQPGLLWGFRRDGDSWVRDEIPSLDLTDRIEDSGNEQGLLGVAVAPDDTALVVDLTVRDGRAGTTVVERHRLDGGVVVPRSRTELLRVRQPFRNHNGGQVAFGPDGMLYVGLGDGGSQGDPDDRAQDPGELLGKLLRLEVTAAGARPPADNPFVGVAGARPEIWLTGVRNPWRFSFDRDTGDLWVADVGGSEREEVNFLPADGGRTAGRGVNLGWEAFEGTRPAGDEVQGPEPVAPWFEYDHDDGCSVTGGYRYRGTEVAGLAGAYVFGDYCRGVVWSIGADGEARSLGATVEGLVSFAEDPDGELYVLAQDDTVRRIVPAR